MLTVEEVEKIERLKSAGVRVISLRAPNGCGKTSTLKKLCEMLAHDPRARWSGRNHYDFEHLDYSKGEIRGHFEINGTRVAVLSIGDAKRCIIESFKYCVKHEIHVVVMAVRSSKDGKLFSAQEVFAEIKSKVEFSEETVWMSNSKCGEKISRLKLEEEITCAKEIRSLIMKEVGLNESR